MVWCRACGFSRGSLNWRFRYKVIGNTRHYGPLQPVNHVEWMQSKHFIMGRKNDLALDRPITLAEAVVMLARVQNKEQGIATADPVINHWGAKALTWAR